VPKADKQYPKSKVCRIRVDGGGEYARCEMFLEYLAEDDIIREVSAPYPQEHNGISERCNRSAGPGTVYTEACWDAKQALGRSCIHSSLYHKSTSIPRSPQSDAIRTMNRDDAQYLLCSNFRLSSIYLDPWRPQEEA
jgi:hypothetical protein